jgi:hypothetical protein
MDTTFHDFTLHLDGRVILKQILKKWDMRIWIGFVWLRMGTSGGFL